MSLNTEHDIDAIILAGGLGTRLREVAPDIPKPMALVNGRPFLEYLLEYVASQNIRRAVLAVGYKSEIIRDFFGDAFGRLKLTYSVESEPMGTGGAIRQAMAFRRGGPVVVINGDTWFPVDIARLVLAREKHQADIAMSLKSMRNFDRYATVDMNDRGRIVAFREIQFCSAGNINGGIYVLSPDIFDGVAMSRKFSFEAFLVKQVERLNCLGIVSDVPFIDIGIPEDYRRAGDIIKSGALG